MTDQEPIAAAILSALNTALPAGVDAFDKDEVPGTADNGWADRPAKFVVIDLSRRPTDAYRHGGGVNTIPGYFLDTTYRADTVTNCRELRRLTCLALEGVAFGSVGPLVFNDETQPIDDDPDGGWSGVDTFQFC